MIENAPAPYGPVLCIDARRHLLGITASIGMML